MKYAVDRIEDNIIVLENLETCEILEVDKNIFENVKEKDIFTLDNGVFKKDLDEQTKREQLIREKLNKLLGDDEL